MDARSEKNLVGVHADLVRVVRQAVRIGTTPFLVTEGLRTPERQQKLLAAGATKTLQSRHLTGHAVDLAALVGGQVRWDWPLYGRLAETLKSAALIEQVPIEWGGDWTSFRDGPHFQLPWDRYPA